jgi:hypothetical protein
MMTLLNKFSFAFNKDETENALRFPDMASSAYIFSFSAGETYVVTVTWDTYTNSPLVSVRTQDNTNINIYMPLSPRINDTSPNFLNSLSLTGYYLFWEPIASMFTLYKDS